MTVQTPMKKKIYRSQDQLLLFACVVAIIAGQLDNGKKVSLVVFSHAMSHVKQLCPSPPAFFKTVNPLDLMVLLG